MKHVVFLGDGMADLPIEELGNQTPLERAKHPEMDKIASLGILGLTKTVPEGMNAGSDVANLSVMGFDPAVCYTGRSPLEAVSMGVPLSDTDMAFRCNLVTISGDPEGEDGIMTDYSSDEISTEEATELINVMRERFNGDRVEFFRGISYRHCLVLHNESDSSACTPPHDITGKPTLPHLPKGKNSALLREMIRYSNRVFPNHPVNLARVEKGLHPANSVWFWGGGTRPKVENFKTRYGVSGAVISGVDLLKGIGLSAGMEVPFVKGATGAIETDFSAKANAAIELLKNGTELVYIHVESPDECGHHGLPEKKVWAIEQIDGFVLSPVMKYLEECGEPYSVLLMPDHPTPCAIRTHTPEPVPFAMYVSGGSKESGARRFTEDDAKKTGVFILHAHTLMQHLVDGDFPQ